MFWNVAVIDIIWLLLMLCFLFAFYVYKINVLPYTLGQLFQDLIRYGKTKENDQGFWRSWFDVPKRRFRHFYALSVLWNGLLLLFCFRCVVMGEALPDWLKSVLRILTNTPTPAWKDLHLSVLVLQGLLWVHSFRRLIECMYVSVFSNGAIHLVQYIFGLVYYVLLGLTVLSINSSLPQTGSLSLFHPFAWYHVFGLLLFLWASLLQHRCLLLLARLRTDSSGKVESLAHRMPHGGWFELVSCPHYLAELLIYISMSVCCGCSSVTWWLVVLYVFWNQALTSQLSHDFYRKKFENYPNQRTAFIPFVM